MSCLPASEVASRPPIGLPGLPVPCQLRRRNAMPDIKGRREANPARPRPRPASERAPEEFEKDILDEEKPVQASNDGAPAAPREPAAREQEHIGFDEETNSRYEEIKRGTTFI